MGAQKSKLKDSTIDDDAAIDAAIEHNNNFFTFSPIKRTANDDEGANKRTRKGHNIANKNNSKMDNNYYTSSKSIGHSVDHTKTGEQDLFASDDEVKEGDTYGCPINILDSNSDENEEELNVSITYSANSPAYSPTSPAYSPTSPFSSPDESAEWNSCSGEPPDYYINSYNRLVNINQPDLTQVTTLINIIENDAKHQQGMSRHFATVGTPSKRLVDYAIDNIVIKGHTTAGPGIKWVNNFENFPSCGGCDQEISN